MRGCAVCALSGSSYDRSPLVHILDASRRAPVVDPLTDTHGAEARGFLPGGAVVDASLSTATGTAAADPVAGPGAESLAMLNHRLVRGLVHRLTTAVSTEPRMRTMLASRYPVSQSS